MHLGYEVVVSISQQGTSPRIGALFVDPYITWLVHHLGAVQGTDLMRVVRGVALVFLEMLCLMRMVHKVQTIRGTEYRVMPTDDTPATDTATPSPPSQATYSRPRSQSPLHAPE